MNRVRRLLLLAACLALAPAPASAQLQPQQQGGIRYLHGGIGEDERFELAAQRADYSLRLTFAVKRAGHFVADVEVRIAAADKREILRAASDGPWFYAQLPTGKYVVTASYGGNAQSRTVQVRDKGAVGLHFYWDDPSALEGADMEPERPAPPRPKPRR